MKATRSLDVHQAKAELSTLIKAVERGREVIICRNGKPVARLVPCSAAGVKRFRVNTWRDRIQVSPDFDRR